MGRIGAVGDVGAAERGSGCLLVDLLELVRPDVGSDDASSAIDCVPIDSAVRQADRGEPSFARHLVADLEAAGDQGVGDGLPPSAQDLGILGAAVDLAPVFRDGDSVAFEGEHDGVQAGVVGWGCGGVGGAGGDHGSCP